MLFMLYTIFELWITTTSVPAYDQVSLYTLNVNINTHIYIYTYILCICPIYMYMRVYSVHALCTGGGGITTTSVPVNEHGSLYTLYIYTHSILTLFILDIYSANIYIYIY